MKKRRSFSVGDVLIYAGLAFMALTVLLPMMYVISSSLTPYIEILKNDGIVLFPKNPTLDGYKTFFEESNVYRALGITVFITVVGTTLQLLISVLMAYPLSRKDLPGRGFFTMMVFIPMVFSAGLIPTYLVVKEVKMLNSIWSMVIPGVVSSYNLMILKSFFQTMDVGYIEAARIDGASEWRTLFSILLPLSLPALCTVGLFGAVSYWNTYYAYVYYISDNNLATLQVLLKRVIASSESMLFEVDVEIPSMTLKMAAVVVTALPIMLVYPFLQKYFIQGVTLGGVKG